MAFESIEKTYFLPFVFAITACEKKSYQRPAEEALVLSGDYSCSSNIELTSLLKKPSF